MSIPRKSHEMLRLNCYITSFVIAFVITIILIPMALSVSAPSNPDSHWYINMAEGNYQETAKPFSYRVLYPFLAQKLTLLTHDVRSSFIVLALVSIFLLLFAVILLLMSKTTLPKILIISLFFTPYIMSLLKEYYLPDLCHAAIISCFFLTTIIFNRWYGILWLLPLFLTRESTILLSLTIILITFYNRENKLAMAALITTFIAIAISIYISSVAPSMPNLHRVNDLLYLFGKIPFNFLRNVLGVYTWFNVNDYHHPIVILKMPKYIHLGAIKTIVFGCLNFDRPLRTLITLLTYFGTLPIILLSIVKFRRKYLNNDIWLPVAVVYGLLTFCLGPSLGSSVERLVGFGWPAFLIATPILLAKYCQDKYLLIGLFSLSFLTSWLPFLGNWIFVNPLFGQLFVIVFAALLHYYTYRMLNNWRNKGAIT
ncbi:MAG: hypothetical protein FD145_19 [Candidatus Saganbacteria bacterium]|uniref:DUF2029 domain-containing protein n=1 Tax=Candidatus Saganbacteria bacterium TaxID=2575572 RepID=A0A833NXM9_UNCSA|nr:MAG: hypothetical protein FD145_19 [Candidatus Saganbacteria bacterium]